MSKVNKEASPRNVTIKKLYKMWEKAPESVKEVGLCEGGEYMVETILQVRHEKNGSSKYLVKWFGWAESYNSFVDDDATGSCKNKISAFVKTLLSLRIVPGKENDEKFQLFKQSLEETEEEEHRQESDEAMQEMDTTVEIEDDELEVTEVIEEEEDCEDEEDDVEDGNEGDNEDGTESDDDGAGGNDIPVNPVLEVISEPSDELILMLKTLKVIPQ